MFVTHHAASRAAQRLGVRTSDHLIVATRAIWNAALELMIERGSVEAWLAVPPQGWRVPIKADATVVLKRHHKRTALVAATVMGGER